MNGSLQAELVEDPAATFGKKLINIVQRGGICLSLSTGVQLGLFKALIDIAPSKESAVTSEELADHLKYKPRYVREWANSVACADVIDHELIDGVDKYWVEPYRQSGLVNEAVKSGLATAVGAKLSLVQACYPVDGPAGTQVDDHPETHAYQASKPSKTDSAAELGLFLAEDEKLRPLLEAGAEVLEVGCGPAIGIRKLATEFPKSRFLATDVSSAVLTRAVTNCAGTSYFNATTTAINGLDNVTCKALDACSIPDDMKDKYDLVLMFNVFHDVPYPDKLAAGIHKALKPGGMLLMRDVNMSESVTENKANTGDTAAFYYAVSSLYCVPTALYHPGSVALGACAGRELIQRMLQEAGFSQIKRIAPSHGLLFIAQK